MRRAIAGVVAANVAAPCLFLLLSGMYSALSEPGSFSEITIVSFIVWGYSLYAGILLALKTTLPISLLLAIIGDSLGLRSLWVHLSGAIAVGIGFALFLNDWTLPEDPGGQRLFLPCIVIGAICGWIYWRIAIKQTPHTLPVNTK